MRQASTKQAKVDGLREAGNAKAVAGEMRQALALFEEAIGLAPTSSVLFELKSQCHLSLEEYVEAVRAARRAVELSPEWNEGALTLGRSLLSLGEVRPAVEVLSKLLGRDGRNEEVREELIYANEALMELRRREADFDLQLNGRAGLDKRELEVARAKRHLLARGADVSSDCWLGGSEGSSWDGEEGEEEEEGEEKVEGKMEESLI
jgi:tetratricopeptide (TPR) repeat protein